MRLNGNFIWSAQEWQESKTRKEEKNIYNENVRYRNELAPFY